MRPRALPVLLLAGILTSTQAPTALARQQSARLGVSAVERWSPMQAERPGRKDPGTATIISIIVIGGGQIYAGDIKRGLMMLGGAYGAIIVGVVASTSAGCDFDSCHDGSYVPLYVGALAATAIWVYGIIDAAPTARRINAKNGYKESDVSPLFDAGPDGRSRVGVRVAF